jgi:hypothetical protein
MNARKLGTIATAVLGLAMFMPAAHASIRDQETRFTFDNAIELPSHVMLPPGTYWFRLSDCMSAPCNAVEIRDVHKKYIATVQTQVASRNLPLDNRASVNALFTQPALDVAEGSHAVQLVKWFFYSGTEEGAMGEKQIVNIIVPTPKHQHVSSTLSASNNSAR